MTTPPYGDSNQDKKDPVLDSLISQIKSNYMENVEIDDLIEFDKSKEKSNATLQFEINQGCITLLIMKRQSNGINRAKLLSIHATGVSYSSENFN